MKRLFWSDKGMYAADDGTYMTFSDHEAEINQLKTRLAEVHCLLDNDESKIIRNAKDGYPEGRPDKELSLLERVRSLCVYAADWKRWTLSSETENESLKTRLAGRTYCHDNVAVEAECERLTAENARIKEVEFPQRIEKVAKDNREAGHREGMETAAKIAEAHTCPDCELAGTTLCEEAIAETIRRTAIK